MLMQGLTLPNPSPSSSVALPPPMQHTTLPSTPSAPHVYPDAVDTTGTAAVRGSKETLPQSSADLSPAVGEVGRTISRTTEWRHRKAAAAKPRKVYCCRVCGKSMSGIGI